MGMPIYRPCMANNSAGTKLGAASHSQILSLGVVLFKGGRSDEDKCFVGTCPQLMLADPTATMPRRCSSNSVKWSKRRLKRWRRPVSRCRSRWPCTLLEACCSGARDWRSNLRYAEVGEALAHPLVKPRAPRLVAFRSRRDEDHHPLPGPRMRSNGSTPVDQGLPELLRA